MELDKHAAQYVVCFGSDSNKLMSNGYFWYAYVLYSSFATTWSKWCKKCLRHDGGHLGRKTQAIKIGLKQRAGRITASKLKAACRTKLHKPSSSLINSICYREANTFSNAATSWGLNNEAQARACYAEEINKTHEHFSVSECGLFVYPQKPFLGASPDGIVYCKCYGSGVCEIKCPYMFRDVDPEATAGVEDFCLLNNETIIRIDLPTIS